jgi:hypothetical protein
VDTKQGEYLGDTHHTVFVRTSPFELGFPIRRRRTFSAGISRARLVWIGSTDPDEVQRKFDALFCRTVELTGEAYFLASPEQIQDFVMTRAAKRRKPLPSNFADSPMDDYLHLLVPSGAAERHLKYSSYAPDYGALNGNFYGDLDQSPFCGSALMEPTEVLFSCTSQYGFQHIVNIIHRIIILENFGMPRSTAIGIIVGNPGVALQAITE